MSVIKRRLSRWCTKQSRLHLRLARSTPRSSTPTCCGAAWWWLPPSLIAPRPRSFWERLDSRLEESDELQSWKAMQNDSLYPAAATLCRNRVVHLVGGKRAAWESALASGLEADKLIWHEAEKHKSPTADWVDDVTADRDIVIVLTEHIGHALSGRVIDACKRRGVTWLPAKTGERWVLEALGAAAGVK